MCTYPAPVDRALRCVRHSGGLNGERSPAVSRVALRRPIDEARSVPSELPRRGDQQGTRGAAVTVRLMTDFPTGMPVIARGKWFRSMTLIPGNGAVGCNPREHPAADVPIRRISRTVQGSSGSGEKVRALPIGQFPEDPLRILRVFSGLGVHGVMVRPDAGRMPAATVRNGSRSAGRQPRPVTFVPRAETSKGRLPPLTWEPVSGFEPLACRLQVVRPHAPNALAARMARVIALTAPAALGLFDASFHEAFHADGEKQAHGCNRA